VNIQGGITVRFFTTFVVTASVSVAVISGCGSDGPAVSTTADGTALETSDDGGVPPQAAPVDEDPHRPEPETPSDIFEKLVKLQKALQEYSYSKEMSGKQPTESILAEDGTPLLSWRVAILPYLGQKKLHDEFDLKKPWDSPENSKLIEKMPRLLQLGEWSPEGKTQFVVITGENTNFTNRVRKRISNLGGDYNQITFTVASRKNSRIWTQPGDPDIDQLSPQNDLLVIGNNQFPVVAAAATVHLLPVDIKRKLLESYLDPQDFPKMKMLDVELLSGGRIPEQSEVGLSLRQAGADIDMNTEGYVRRVDLFRVADKAKAFEAILSSALTRVEVLSMTESAEWSGRTISSILNHFPHPESIDSLGIRALDDPNSEERQLNLEGIRRFTKLEQLRLHGKTINEADFEFMPDTQTLTWLQIPRRLAKAPAILRHKKNQPKLYLELHEER